MRKQKECRKGFRKDYYFISNPTMKNQFTGNACVKQKDILSFDKDFMYQYVDADLKEHNIVMTRNMVLNHIKPCIKRVETLDGDLKRLFACYLIKIEDVLKYGKEV